MLRAPVSGRPAAAYRFYSINEVYKQESAGAPSVLPANVISMRLLLRHPLIHTLVNLRGNARACVYTEPMWGVSLNLVLPYMSVFMLAIGFNDVQVGLIASIYMASQMVFSFLSGALTDKMGRRKTIAIFDALGWVIPCLVWIFAVDFKFFVAAAIFNGAMRVPVNAWSCLMIEDTDKSQITHIFTLVMISGNMSALFSPITAVLISKLTLIPAIRILIAWALIVMSVKIVLLYAITRETTIGVVRMRETKDQSYASLIGGYFGVLKLMRKKRGLVFAIAIAALFAIISVVNSTFWQIIATKKLGVPESSLPIYAMIRSFVALFFYFAIIARINQQKLRNPLLVGFGAFFVGQLSLILIPQASSMRFVMLFASMLFDILGLGILIMLSESMIAINAEGNERARMLAIYQMIVMAISTPFGWIGGRLSQMSRDFPFILNMSLIVVGIIITLIHFKGGDRAGIADAGAPDAPLPVNR